MLQVGPAPAVNFLYSTLGTVNRPHRLGFLSPFVQGLISYIVSFTFVDAKALVGWR